jgi:serine O-acetyltransferase
VPNLLDHLSALNWHAVRLYRVSRRLWLADHRALAGFVSALNRVLTGVEIPPSADFGPGLLIMHGHGIVVHGQVRAGRDCVLYQQVTLGSRSTEGTPPTLGDDVVLFPGAKVLGHVTLGDHARIGANAVVIEDVPTGGVATAPLARVVVHQASSAP